MKFDKTEEDLYLLVPSEEGKIEVDDALISDHTVRHLAVVYEIGESSQVISVLSFKTEAEVRAAFMTSAVYEESDEYTRLYELKLGQAVES